MKLCVAMEYPSEVMLDDLGGALKISGTMIETIDIPERPIQMVEHRYEAFGITAEQIFELFRINEGYPILMSHVEYFKQSSGIDMVLAFKPYDGYPNSLSLLNTHNQQQA